MSTIFRKIIDGEIPCHKVYEDDNNLAFLDINPRAKGHTLVISKTDGATLFDLSEEAARSLMTAVQKTMKVLQEKLNPEGFNIGINHGDVGGQEVQHVHVHIFPRYSGDNGTNVHAIVNNPGDMSVEDVANLFV